MYMILIKDKKKECLRPIKKIKWETCGKLLI